MSGICGIVRFDGAPVDGVLLERMIEGIAWRGPEGRGRFIEGSAGLGFVRFATTPEAVREVQPLADGESGLVLVMDGRVDNREEMLAALRQRGATLPEDTDAHILLASWKVWGEESLQRVVGDFALAIWNARRRTLVAARDCMGLRPFYWAADAVHLVFASSPLAVRESAAFRRGPNEAVMAEVLVGSEVHPRETLWEGIQRLPPGFLLETGDSGPRWRRWWDPTVDHRTRGRRDGEMVEEFRTLLAGAVEARLRPGRGVGILLSGGVDSGGVGLVAARLAARVPGDPRLRSWTITFPGREFDEGPAAEETAGSRLDARLIPYECGKDPSGRGGCDPAGFPVGDSLAANLTRTCALAREAGDPVLLTGDGGDEFAGRKQADLSIALSEGRLLEFARQVLLLSRRRPRSLFALLVGEGLSPLFPRWVGGPLRRRALRASRFPWMEGAFLERIDLPARREAAARESATGGRIPRRVPGFVTTGWWQESYEEQERYMLAGGVEVRHPLLDRRLVEFLLRVPAALRWNGRESKIILRRALAGDAPPGLCSRERKPNATAIFDEHAGRAGPDRGDRFHLLEGRGILVPGFFREDIPAGGGRERLPARFTAESLNGWLGSL